MLRLSVFLLSIFSGSALLKTVWKSFRVLHDHTRMPLPAHSLTHQNQPRVYPPPTPVSFLPLHGSDILFAWSFLFLDGSLTSGRLLPSYPGQIMTYPWLSTQGFSPAPCTPVTTWGRGQVCADELVAQWAEQEGVCSQLDTQMCSWLILTLPRNDIPSCIKWLAKTLSAPFLRVTKRFEWCQWQEHFVRRIISFAYIQKIIHHYSDRQDWVERARPRLWFVTDKISSSLSVYHVLWSYLIFMTSESGLREV